MVMRFESSEDVVNLARLRVEMESSSSHDSAALHQVARAIAVILHSDHQRQSPDICASATERRTEE